MPLDFLHVFSILSVKWFTKLVQFVSMKRFLDISWQRKCFSVLTVQKECVRVCQVLICLGLLVSGPCDQAWINDWWPLWQLLTLTNSLSANASLCSTRSRKSFLSNKSSIWTSQDIWFILVLIVYWLDSYQTKTNKRFPQRNTKSFFN